MEQDNLELDHQEYIKNDVIRKAGRLFFASSNLFILQQVEVG